MGKKDKGGSKNKKPKYKILEDKIKILNYTKFEKPLNKGLNYYLIYFIDLDLISIFVGDHSKRKKTELPILIIKITELYNINYRIPQKLNDIFLEFIAEDKDLMLQFQSEELKNQMGDKLKKKLKILKANPKKEENEYTDVEQKYKIAKIIETMSFSNHMQNYDYRKYLSFEYMDRFNEIYNNKSETYKDFYNKCFMGSISIVEVNSNIKRSQTFRQTNPKTRQKRKRAFIRLIYAFKSCI